MQRFNYQPAWLDFIIFWGAIVAGFSLCIILQMEFGAYERGYWPAGVLALVLAAISFWQIRRLHLTITATDLIFDRFFAGNQLIVPINSIEKVNYSAHSLTLTTGSYGKITIVRLRKLPELLAALKQANIPVTTD